ETLNSSYRSETEKIQIFTARTGDGAVAGGVVGHCGAGDRTHAAVYGFQRVVFDGSAALAAARGPDSPVMRYKKSLSVQKKDMACVAQAPYNRMVQHRMLRICWPWIRAE
ncbi:hypothetical protein, partial [Thiolapillus sp.]